MGGGFGIISMLMSIVPIGFIVIGVLGFLSVRKKSSLLRTAPVQPQPAIVIGKRASVSGGGENSSASTSYFATFEFENEARREFEVRSDLYSQLSEGDPGIVYTIADTAADFDRVHVD
jgi:hypothetical protein